MAVSGWGGISSFIEEGLRRAEEDKKRKQEEERRRQEEARRASLIPTLNQWRPDNPLNTSQGLRPDVTKQPNRIDLGPRPTVQSGYSPSTATPQLGESVTPQSPTVGSPLQTPNMPPVEPVQPRSEEPALNPRRQQQINLAQWNLPNMTLPDNSGVVQPPAALAALPSVGNAVGGVVQNIADNWQKYLVAGAAAGTQAAKQNAFGPLGQTLAQFVEPAIDPSSPINAILDLTKERIATREQERKQTSAILATQGPLGQTAGTLSDFSPIRLLGGTLDILQGLAELGTQATIPGTDKTLAEAYTGVRSVLDQARGDDQVQAAYDKAWMPVFSPAAWTATFSSFGNVADYWDNANQGMLEAVTPSAEQLTRSTPEQIAKAKALAQMMTHHGIDAMAATFDNYLDYPVQSADLTQRSVTLAQTGDQESDPIRRQQLYAEAGRLAAEAAKLREMTPLDLYNKNQNWGYSLWAEMMFDPLNAVTALSDVARVAPAARRFKQGERLAEMAADAAPGANRTIMDAFKDNALVKWMQTNHSKAMVDSYTNFGVLTNILGGFHTKGDIMMLVGQYIRDPEQLIRGIPLARFSSTDAALQAADGLVTFGQSGIRDTRAVAAHKSLPVEIAQWVTHLPSLQGDATEMANGYEVMSDLLGMMMRAAAQGHDASRLAGVPFGAVDFRVVTKTPGQAVVEYLNEAKQVIGTSADMTAAAANKAAKTAQDALKAGAEFKTNYIKAIGDFERNLMSTFVLNPNPGSIITNAMGGNLTGVMDQGFRKEFLHPLSQQIEYMTGKLGGMFPSARIAEGAGGVPVSGATFGSQNISTGFNANKFLNWASLGLTKLSRAGRNLRQGSATIADVLPVGEEAIAANIYYTAYKNFIDRTLPRLLEPEVRSILADAGVQSADTTKWVVDQVIQSGLSGGRIDIARTFREIANGKIAPSLRNLSPDFYHVFDPSQVLEIDGLLRNITPEGVGEVQRRIAQIIDERRTALSQQMASSPHVIRKQFWTERDDAKDVADILDMLQVAAQKTGRNPDEAMTIAQEVQAAQREVNEAMVELLQEIQERPWLSNFIYNTWGQVKAIQDNTRAGLYELAEAIGDASTQSRGPVVAQDRLEQMWEAYWQHATARWRDFGSTAKGLIEATRDDILNGTAEANLRAGVANKVDNLQGTNLEEVEARAWDLLSNLGVDMEEVRGFMQTKLGWAKEDPNFWPTVNALRMGVDKYQAEMFVALGRYPNMRSFDEFLNAISDVGKRASITKGQVKGLIDAAVAAKGTADETRLWAIAKQQQDKLWKEWFKFAWDRYSVGARRIVEVNLPDSLLDSLTFTRYGQPDDQLWKLISPDLNDAKLWLVLAPDGRKTKLPVGKGGVPEELIEKYNEIRRIAEQNIADQIGALARQAQREGVSTPEVDRLLAQVGGQDTQDLYAQVRASVQEAMATPGGAGSVTGDYLDYVMDRLDRAEAALQRVIGQAAQMNSQGYGRLDLGVVSNFNKRILPLFDNVLTGAKRYADEMVSFSVLDYTRQYHPDVLLGLGVPYHFFATRSAKNALERMLFHPFMSQQIIRFNHQIETENRAADMPVRNLDSIPNSGPTFGDTTYRIGTNMLARWIPVLPLFVMQGWADPERANRAYELMQDEFKGQGWPATAKGLAGNLLYFKELTEEMGLSYYPWIDYAIEEALGLRHENHLAQLGPIPRALGWASVRFADWAKESGIPLVPQINEWMAQNLTPHYAPYLYGREGTFDARRGDVTGLEAQFIQDVAMQHFFDIGALPEQELLVPNAPELYRGAQVDVSTEYLIKSLITWLTGVPIASVYGPEMELRQDKQVYQDSNYDAMTSPGGSREGRYGMTDPNSPDHVPGLAPALSQYAVTGEEAPNVPDPDAKRPGLVAAERQYYDERDAIFEKYRLEREATYQEKQWRTTEDSSEKSAYDKDVKARQDAELDALNKRFPSVVANQGDGGPSTYFGARPAEVRAGMQQEAVDRAYENVEGLKPADKVEGETNEQRAARRDQREAYEAALVEEIGKVANAMADPNNPYFPDMKIAEEKYGLPAGLLQEVAREESGFDPEAKSGAGAQGLMQIMPDTWDEWAPKVGATDPMDPVDNIEVSAAYLQWLMNTLPDDQQDIASVMTAYNWGIGNVLDGVLLPPPETTAYANRIAAAVPEPVAEEATVMSTTGGPTFVSPLPAGTRVSQGYGDNVADYQKWNENYGHEGIDYGVPVGTPVAAAAGGVVEFAGEGNGFGNYGKYVVVDHGNGYKSYYAHLSGFDVKEGDTVTAGQQIALSGNTGANTTGPHLHFGIQHEGDPNANNYGMVDPATNLASLASGQSPAAGAVAISPAAGPTTAFGKTPEEMLTESRDRFKGPEQIKTEASINQAFDDQRQRASQTYPGFETLFDEYYGVNEEDRPAWRLANPMIKAINLVAYSPEEWQYVEDTWGAGTVEKWAKIPPYKGEGDDSASNYYHQYPDVFLAKAWIQGRPELFDDSNFDPDKEFSYNFGADYEQAKELFGEGIWDVVRQYYTTPKYVKGQDNTAWIAFKEAHPEFDQWRAWWYAKLGNDNQSTFQPWQPRSFGFSGFSGRSAGFQPQQFIEEVAPYRGAPPAWRGVSRPDGDWRKYLNLGK